jgi:hypothetical protein
MNPIDLSAFTVENRDELHALILETEAEIKKTLKKNTKPYKEAWGMVDKAYNRLNELDNEFERRCTLSPPESPCVSDDEASKIFEQLLESLITEVSTEVIQKPEPRDTAEPRGTLFLKRTKKTVSAIVIPEVIPQPEPTPDFDPEVPEPVRTPVPEDLPDEDDDDRTLIPTNNGKRIWYLSLTNDITAHDGTKIKCAGDMYVGNPEVTIISKQVSYKSKKTGEQKESFNFTLFNSLNDAAKFVTGSAGRSNKSFYSVLQSHESVRPYFDLDYKDETLTLDNLNEFDEREDEFASSGISAIIKAVKKCTNVTLTPSDFITTFASRNGKLSVHIECRNHYVTKVKHVGVIAKVANKIFSDIDTKPYNNVQNWRLFGSCKISDPSSVLIFKDEQQAPDMSRILPQQTEGCTLLQLLPEYSQVSKGTDGEPITDIPEQVAEKLKEILGEYSPYHVAGPRIGISARGVKCPFHEKVHTSNNFYVKCFEDGTWVLRCYSGREIVNGTNSIKLWKDSTKEKVEFVKKNFFPDEEYYLDDFLTEFSNRTFENHEDAYAQILPKASKVICIINIGGRSIVTKDSATSPVVVTKFTSFVHSYKHKCIKIKTTKTDKKGQVAESEESFSIVKFLDDSNKLTFRGVQNVPRHLHELGRLRRSGV